MDDKSGDDDTGEVRRLCSSSLWRAAGFHWTISPTASRDAAAARTFPVPCLLSPSRCRVRNRVNISGHEQSRRPCAARCVSVPSEINSLMYNAPSHAAATLKPGFQPTQRTQRNERRQRKRRKKHNEHNERNSRKKRKLQLIGIELSSFQLNASF